MEHVAGGLHVPHRDEFTEGSIQIKEAANQREIAAALKERSAKGLDKFRSI